MPGEGLGRRLWEEMLVWRCQWEHTGEVVCEG